MNTISDIRPHTQPITFAAALDGVAVVRWIDASASVSARLTQVSGVTVGSHDVEPGWIFVAIPGLIRHGAHFVPDAVQAGVVAVVTDDAGATLVHEAGVAVPIAVVEDPRAATAVIAGNMYGHPASRLVTMSVTGTNGKTTTSYLMRAALQVRFPDPSLCGTVETHVGSLDIPAERTTNEAPVVNRLLALTVEQDLGAAVVENSAHAMTLNRVDGIVFDVSAFTNLQHDHLDYYHDMEHYFQAKKILFTPEHTKHAVVCVDDQWGQRLAQEATVPVTTVSALSDHPANWMVTETHPDQDTLKTVFTLKAPDGSERLVHAPILGGVNVQNTVIAIVSAVVLGMPVDEVIEAVEHSQQVPGRMEKVNPTPHPRQPLVVVDYAHTPEGLDWTLKTVRELTSGQVVLVFGTDGDRDPSKREGVGQVGAEGADVLWVTDENPRTEDPQIMRDALLRGIRRVRPDLHDVTQVTTCRRDAVRHAILHAGDGDTVVITGKGAEWYQDIEGIKHVYNDVPVSQEVLEQDPRLLD